MTSLLIRCYPARWRARYGDEFEAILEERPLGPFDVADILLGALDAQLRLRGHGVATQHARRFTMSLRIGGIAAIVGASLIVIGIALTAGNTEGSQNAGGIALLVALAALLVALTGMSAFQARSNPWLVWTAFAVTAVGSVLIFIAGVSDLAGVGPTRLARWPSRHWSGRRGPWLGRVRDRDVPRSRAIAQGGIVPRDRPGGRVDWRDRRGSESWEVGMLLATVGFLSFLAGWFTLGVAAFRLDRMSALKPA